MAASILVMLGIDVSQYQGAPDWRAVAASGVRFAFARVSRGRTPDTRYAVNRTAIPAAGLTPGAYHHLAPGSGTAQADLFCRLADPYAIHSLDVEEAGLDVAGWVAQHRTAYPGKRLLIYTGRDLWTRSGGGDGARFAQLWLAGYLPNRYVAGTGSLRTLMAKIGSNRGALPWGGWTAAAFMQFTDAAAVPGIDGPVDGDLFFGDLAELQALTGIGVGLTESDLEAIAVRTRDRLLEVTYGEDAARHPFTLALLLGELRTDYLRAVSVPDAEALAAAVALGVPQRVGALVAAQVTALMAARIGDPPMVGDTEGVSAHPSANPRPYRRRTRS
ncbi:MAG TPA: glycoside hydrolase family 25 protein [Kineosporiaceae bacterium]|nr:glycoside hydrolase family 25 protein [Kineosporiaceae bacterium]